MATAQTIIDSALRKNGVASPTATQRANGLEALNDMISNWSADGLIIPYNTTESLTLVVGQSVYTIGSAGDFNTTRPLKIVNAFIRDSNNDDHAVDVTMTEAEYNAIEIKDAEERPTKLYYDPQYSLGKIYFNYEPSTAETLYLISEKPITELAALATTVSLPDFYKECLTYNLAVRLAAEYDNQLLPQVIEVANISKNTLENLNSLNKLQNTVKMDSALTYTLYR